MRGLNSSNFQIISLWKKYSDFQGIIITVPIRLFSKILFKTFLLCHCFQCIMTELEESLRAPMEIPLKVAFEQSLEESQYLHEKSNFNFFGMQPCIRTVLVYGAQNMEYYYSQTNFKWLWTWAILMMLLCEKEKLPHAYSNDNCSMCQNE